MDVSWLSELFNSGNNEQFNNLPCGSFNLNEKFDTKWSHAPLWLPSTWSISFSSFWQNFPLIHRSQRLQKFLSVFTIEFPCLLLLTPSFCNTAIVKPKNFWHGITWGWKEEELQSRNYMFRPSLVCEIKVCKTCITSRKNSIRAISSWFFLLTI